MTGDKSLKLKMFGNYLTLLLIIVVPYLLLFSYGKALWENPSLTLERTKLIFGAYFLVWSIVPQLQIWLLKDDKLTAATRRQASIYMIKKIPSGLLMTFMSLSAFFAVPIIVGFFVKREDTQLPGIWQKLYGDKNGIDGDNVWWVEMQRPNGTIGGWRIPIPLNPTPEQQAVLDENQYFKGIKQGTKAYRILWLLRNKCTQLAEDMGDEVEEYSSAIYGFQQPLNSRENQFGVQLLQSGDSFEIAQLFSLKWLVFRTRWGVKISNEAAPWADTELVYRRPRFEMINISFSLKRNKAPS